MASRGTITSFALFLANRSDFVNKSTSLKPRVPSSPEVRIKELRSSRFGTRSSSCAGSTPNRRVNQFEVASESAMIGFAAKLYIRNGFARAFAVRLVFAIAIFFGTSSPNIIAANVAKTIAKASETLSFALSPTMLRTGPSSTEATVGFAIKPISTAVIVIPSCAPANWYDNSLRIFNKALE